MVIRASLAPRLLDAHAVSGAAPLGPMAPFLGARLDPGTFEPERLSIEDRDALERVRAFEVPALQGIVIDFPRTLEANREIVSLLQRTLTFPFEWKIERPIFGALHKQAQLVVSLDAPDDEATHQPMCLHLRGPVTHVENVALDSVEGVQRLERVQRSFSATTDFRATLRSFSMRARVERAVWANVQAPFH